MGGPYSTSFNRNASARDSPRPAPENVPVTGGTENLPQYASYIENSRRQSGQTRPLDRYPSFAASGCCAARLFTAPAVRFFCAGALVLRDVAARAGAFSAGAAASSGFVFPARVRRMEATSLSPVLSFVVML
jgi:hypothetical protein